jgi:hypothetical protein
MSGLRVCAVLFFHDHDDDGGKRGEFYGRMCGRTRWSAFASCGGYRCGAPCICPRRTPFGSRLRWPMAFLTWQPWSITPSCGSICRMSMARSERGMAVAGEARPLITKRSPGFVSSQPATSPRSACNFGPAAKTGCWPDTVSRGSRCNARTRELEIPNRRIGFRASGWQTRSRPSRYPGSRLNWRTSPTFIDSSISAGYRPDDTHLRSRAYEPSRVSLFLGRHKMTIDRGASRYFVRSKGIPSSEKSSGLGKAVSTILFHSCAVPSCTLNSNSSQ